MLSSTAQPRQLDTAEARLLPLTSGASRVPKLGASKLENDVTRGKLKKIGDDTIHA